MENLDFHTRKKMGQSIVRCNDGKRIVVKDSIDAGAQMILVMQIALWVRIAMYEPGDLITSLSNRFLNRT
jgi:hypothetical protein